MDSQVHPPPSPPSPELSPADRALAAEGGEVVPGELSGHGGAPQPLDFKDVRPLVDALGSGPAVAPDSPTRRVIDVPDGVLARGTAPPPGIAEAPKKSKEQEELEKALDSHIAFETAILDNCLSYVHNMVQWRVQATPLDSADVQQATWGAGQRSPLEAAEPQLALEVYRNVRQNMREEARVSLLGRFWRFLGRLFR